MRLKTLRLGSGRALVVMLDGLDNPYALSQVVNLRTDLERIVAETRDGRLSGPEAERRLRSLASDAPDGGRAATTLAGLAGAGGRDDAADVGSGTALRKVSTSPLLASVRPAQPHPSELSGCDCQALCLYWSSERSASSLTGCAASPGG